MKRKLLKLLVKFFHRNQVRKYTGDPYITHLEAVADLTLVYLPEHPVAYEIGLCHDLFEDTKCTPKILIVALRFLGYSSNDTVTIVKGVKDLTDVYTKENYPSMNRANRKQREAIRLGQCEPDIQTIKYCDMMDNTVDIAIHDKKFAKTYLKEKRYALNQLVLGNERLREQLFDITDTYTKRQ